MKMLHDQHRVLAVQVFHAAGYPVDLCPGEDDDLGPHVLGEQQHGQLGVGGERDEDGLWQQRPQFTS